MPSPPVGELPWLLHLRLAARGDTAPRVPPASEPGVNVWRTPDGDDVAYGFRACGRHWMHWPSLATYGFTRDERFVTAYPISDASLSIVRDVYSRSVLPMALQALGFEAMHASGIVDRSGVTAFAGRSKAGKSTVAFGLSCRGYRQWSDDAVVFHPAGDPLEALPLPFGVRLRPQSPVRLAPRPAAADEQGVRTPTRIARICLLSQRTDGGPPVHIRSIAWADAFRELLTHAHEFEPSNRVRRGRMLDSYMALAAGVPVFEATYRPGREAFEDVLDAIVDRLGITAAD
jgi:hypothetical protein